jgi:hypothetical protein
MFHGKNIYCKLIFCENLIQNILPDWTPAGKYGISLGLFCSSANQQACGFYFAS